MKRFLLSLLCATLILAPCLSGCSDNHADETDTETGSESVTEPASQTTTETETGFETVTETETEPVTETETETQTEIETETEIAMETETTTETETETITDVESATEEAEAATLDVEWHRGYVGSSKNTAGHANSVYAERKYLYSDVIRLEKKGTMVTFTDEAGKTPTGEIYVVSFWKQSGDNWVIDLDRANIPGDVGLAFSVEDGRTVYTYISKYDNECIRFSLPTGTGTGKPAVYISETDLPPTTQDFLSDSEKHALWLEQDKERAFYENLQGKTFTVIGDSYLAGNGLDKSLVWPALLAEKYGMEYKNYGVNGSTLSNYVTSNNPMVDRYTAMAQNDPDIVIIEGGRNDYNKSVPLGEDGSMDTKTMKGAARYLITKLRERYPNATIICLTVWEVGGKANSIGNYCSDYGRALLEVCADMDVPCINAMDQELTGVYMTDADFRAQYCMKPTDISHLNADGMKLVFPVFERLIAENVK